MTADQVGQLAFFALEDQVIRNCPVTLVGSASLAPCRCERGQEDWVAGVRHAVWWAVRQSRKKIIVSFAGYCEGLLASERCQACRASTWYRCTKARLFLSYSSSQRRGVTGLLAGVSMTHQSEVRIG